MNGIFKIAVILSLIFSLNCASVQAQTPITESEKNEIIHLDVHKTEQFKADVKTSLTEKETDEDIKKDTVSDNIDPEFSIFDEILDTDRNEEHPFKIEEESLFGKIYKKKLERTSIPSYLLKDELTFRYKKGPVHKAQFYGAYQGSLTGTFEPGDFDRGYEFGIAEIGVVGAFKKETKTDFKVQMNFKPVSGQSYLHSLFTDVYIMNTTVPNHKIIVGNSRNQVGIDGGASSYTLPFATRSQIGRNFGNVRVLGVRVVGNYPLIDYQMAVNSSDRYFHEFFPGAEFTGWINFKPLGKTDGKYGNLTIGTGVNTGRRHGDYSVGGAYVGYSYKKFAVNAEYAIADGYNGKVYSDKKATGFYTTVSYRLTKRLHALLRYDQFDPNREVSGNLKREYTAGLNYFIKGQALRLILNYVFCENQNADDSHRIILGTQIVL